MTGPWIVRFDVTAPPGSVQIAVKDAIDMIGVPTTAGAVLGMRLLEPGFAVDSPPARVIGRLRVEGVQPAMEDAVDAALEAAGLTVHSVHLHGWDACWEPFEAIVLGELWQAHHALLDAEGLSEFVNSGLHAGRAVSPERLAAGRAGQQAWRAEVAAAFAGIDLLALPTMPAPPPTLREVRGFPITQLTAPFNLAGVPALALPVARPGPAVPPSLQLVGPHGGEGLLCATGLMIEAALLTRG